MGRIDLTGEGLRDPIAFLGEIQGCLPGLPDGVDSAQRSPPAALPFTRFPQAEQST